MVKRTVRDLISAAVLAGTACGTVVAAEPVAIRAEALPAVRTIDERFQSFQVGMSHLTGGETWRSYDSLPKGQGPTAPGNVSAVREARPAADLENARLRTLTSALGPLYLRYSGTTANSVYFQDNDEPQLTKAPDGYTVVLTRAAWKRGLEFAKAVDAKVVTSFTVSSGVRDSSHSWKPTMAAPWMAYTRSIGGEIFAAELFNEPNAPEPPHVPKGYTAAEYTRDFATFRSFMAKAAPDVKMAGPGEATIGVPIPSIDRVSAEEYITTDPKPRFDIVSYHFYGAVAERCVPPNSPAGMSVDRALSEEWLARPDGQFQKHKALRDRHAPGAPLWITETGAAACGGTRWQPTFLDTFRYLDTHARLAKQGVDAMFTHALISGSNGVIDEKTLLPNADYWAALLWRRLMGTKVLDAGPAQPGLHIYAHCLRGAPGGVTVLAINLAKASAKISFAGPADLYAMTAPELESRSVLLNGRPLELGPGDTLPVLEARRLKGKSVSLAATSVNFITLPQARNPACMNAPVPAQPEIGSQSVPVIAVSGQRFRDLDRDGRLTPYEDWRLSADVRTADPISRMTLEEKAGAMLHPVMGTAEQVTKRNINSVLTRSKQGPKGLAEENNAFQRAAEATRLEIPVTISSDPRNGFRAARDAQKSDVPHDSLEPLYAIGHGLSF